MRKPVQFALVGAIAVAALLAGLYTRLETSPDASSPLAVLALTSAAFKDLSGQTETLGRWQGQVLVVNFWASWCPPCRDEIPGLARTQARFGSRGVQVVGIAVDSHDNARQAATELGVNYPVLIAGMEAIDLARQLGNRAGALPFTVVLDREGRLLTAHLGVMTEADLAHILAPLLS